MDYVNYRKHPRVYSKKTVQKSERSLNLSAAAAAGILALVFFKGMFWGYLIRRKMG